MAFDVAADAYDRFMGRYSRLLSAPFADLAGVRPRSGLRVLDVGSGPGALTEELVARLGPDSVAAVDPSPPFVLAARARLPGVDVREAAADALPFADGAFDAALAQLVVHFLPDPDAGLREMARVTRPGGVVIASVWDFAGGRAPLSTFWRAARELDPAIVDDESARPGARQGHLAELLAGAGLVDVTESALDIQLVHESFDDWWEPYEGGVGPAGAYLAGLPAEGRAALRERCRELLPQEPFEVAARAWAAHGRVTAGR